MVAVFQEADRHAYIGKVKGFTPIPIIFDSLTGHAVFGGLSNGLFANVKQADKKHTDNYIDDDRCQMSETC